MARGAEAKLRRRNVRKGIQQGEDNNDNDHNNEDDNDLNGVTQEGEEDVIDMFGTINGKDPFPLPTKATAKKSTTKSKVIVEDVDSDEDDNDIVLPKKSKKKSSRNKNDTISDLPDGMKSSGSSSGIKTTPLILLIMMVGTTVLPALIYVGDYASTVLFKNSGSKGKSGTGGTMNSIGYYLGLGGPIPKHRTLSFYEKHAPEKISDVPAILSKHYGTYPTLIKKLERKYQDYGYFIGWESDETSVSIRNTIELLQSFYSDVWITQYWNVYAPQVLKTSFRNIRYNLTFVYQNVLYKKLYKVYWKKHIWPKYLQPIFGVPDGVDQQKKRDARDAERNKRNRGTSTGSRRKNTEYRDEHDEE